MSEHKHEELRRIFDLALAARTQDRAALLLHECRGDQTLQKRVEAMIAAAEGNEFLTDPTANVLHASSSVPTIHSGAVAAGHESPGTRIGPYKLLQLIGEGGFGSVFMAEQERPVARKVALKIIKLGMDTKAVIARFEAERQALALMDHPNIAKVFDAGATETGRPYFAMELCKGDPITHYCDKQNLRIRDRLELFAQVCQAVQHAHGKGVIHRDLKPSNILVSSQDGRAHAKVIDFGIAKATASKLTEKTLFTEHKQLIGTPEYMSPEQAEGSLDIDTRTDVYSLGVLLYELLTGSTPFNSKDLRSAAYAEIQRIIREVDPPKPSTRLSESAETIASVAASRHTEPRKLGTIIRGELDWIVMKALEKDRTRRYETANALGADILRYLSGEAIVAAPPSRMYRASKFVRRHKGGVAAGTAIGVSLLIGIVAFGWQARVAQNERDDAIKARTSESEQKQIAENQRVIADQQRDLATQEAARAKAMNSFMEQLLQGADPDGRGGRDVTVLELLARASVKAGKTLAEQPQVEAAARTLLASTFNSLGKVSEAEVELERALTLHRQHGTEGTIPMAETLRTLGLNRLEKGDWRGAKDAFEQAQAILLKTGGGSPDMIVTGHTDLARTYIKLGESTQAERALDRADEVARTSGPIRPRTSAYVAGIRADFVQHAKHDLPAAEALCEQAVAFHRQDGTAVSIALALNNLAVVRMSQGKLDQALASYKEALELTRKEEGESGYRGALILENMANVYFQKKELDTAQDMLGEVLKTRESLFGPDSMTTARTRFNMSSIAIRRADFKLGLELADAVLPIFKKNVGEKSPDYAQVIRNRAECLKGLGDTEAALRELRAALDIIDAAAAPSSPQRLRILLITVETYCQRGETDKAQATADLALKALDESKPDQAKWIKNFRDLLAKCTASPKSPSP